MVWATFSNFSSLCKWASLEIHMESFRILLSFAFCIQNLLQGALSIDKAELELDGICTLCCHMTFPTLQTAAISSCSSTCPWASCFLVNWWVRLLFLPPWVVDGFSISYCLLVEMIVQSGRSCLWSSGKGSSGCQLLKFTSLVVAAIWGHAVPNWRR